jgi:hypothetical protein
VLSLNRVPGEGITVNQPTGDVIATANIAQVRIQSSTLSVSSGTGQPGQLAVIRSGETPITINLPQTLSNISNINIGNNLTTNTLVVNVAITGSTATFSSNVDIFLLNTNSLNANLASIQTANIGVANVNNIISPVANIANLQANTATITGNITANRFIGDGSLLSNVLAAPSPFIENGNSIVIIPNPNGNILANVNGVNVATISATGLNVTGNINANRFNGVLANGGTSNVNITGPAGNINLSIDGTSRVVVSPIQTLINNELVVSNNTSLQALFATDATLSGNLVAGRLTSTVTGISPISVQSNVMVANLNAELLNGFAPSILSNVNSIVVRDSSGNISVNGIIGNGAGLTNLQGNQVIGAVNQSTFANIVVDSAQPNITSVGTLTGLFVNGQEIEFNVVTANLGSVDSVKIQGGFAGQILGTDGAGNLSWQSAASADTAITVTANAQPNITSVGTLTNLTTTGNIISNENIAAANNVSAETLSGTLTTGPQPNISEVGTLGNLTVTNSVDLISAVTSLGDISSVILQGGIDNQVIKTDGTGNLFWTTTGQAENVIYVSKSGNDNNTGVSLDNAKLTIKAAAAIATPGTVIFVKAGDYTEDNPISLAARVSVIGDNLRSVSVRPANPTLDIFHVRNGDYLFGMTFRDHLEPSAAVAFPASGAGNIFTSPYVQSCSSITTTGAGMRVDGNLAGGLKSMVTDSFTQFNQGGKGVHITNKGYAQLVSIFTINCSIGVHCDNGGQCSVANSNNSFGDFGLVADGQSEVLYSGAVVDFVNGRVTVSNLSQRPAINDSFRFVGDPTWYTVVTATELDDGTSIIRFSQPAGETPPAGTVVNFHQPSLINASGQTFEYVGTGTDLLTSTPRLGGVPIQEHEVVFTNGGIVNWTSTDHFGDFRIGSGLVIEKEAGTISGNTFERGLFAVLTPYILALEGGN